jgi:hypothetical protein
MTTPTPADRDFVRALFGRPEPAEEPEAERKPNVVPGEGQNTTPANDADAEFRRFVSELFGSGD